MAINSLNIKQYYKNSAQSFDFENKLRTGSNPYYEVTPETALNWDFNTSIEALSNLIGKNEVQSIFNGKDVQSPHGNEKTSEWLQQSKVVGINPRAIGSYFDIVKYAMTFPEDSLHLLPLFEQGCQGSLYAPVNFKLTDEFMDKDLEKLGFDTPEKQLKLTINLLHALNKSVGMDFLQHTDRFSEEVFINPDNFIWAKVDDSKQRELQYPEIHPDKIGDDVKKAVVDFLKENGDAKGQPVKSIYLQNFYNLSEDRRREILFGRNNSEQKTQRRVALMNHVRNANLETKPISLDDPRRKIVFKEMKSNNGVTWANFTDNMGDRMFGNLTGYKLYHLDENGQVDISKPNKDAWDFVCKQNAQFQKDYNFDFLRADMGYLTFDDETRDIHAKVKEYIQSQGAPYFASLGECFCGFGKQSDADGIKRKNYDSVLGNLHYENVYDYNFNDIVKAYNFSPDYKVSLTSITADSDQARYNQHYDNFQSKIRTFFGLFLNQPSYMGMGLETREDNPTEGKNLTKDFINDWGIKKYEWGNNQTFFKTISEMRNIFAKIKDDIQKQLHYWLWTSDKKVASWFYYTKNTMNPSYLFVSNTDTNQKDEVEIQNLFDTNMSENINKNCDALALKEVYSSEEKDNADAVIMVKGKSHKIRNLKPGECRIYRISNPKIIEDKINNKSS